MNYPQPPFGWPLAPPAKPKYSTMDAVVAAVCGVIGANALLGVLFFGGIMMLSLVSSKSAALVGVFISVTTVPAAGFAAVAAILGDWGMAARSVTQLAVNLVGIVVAGVLVLLLRPRGNLIPLTAQT